MVIAKAILISLSILNMIGLCYAQTTIPKKNIPRNVPFELRQAIEKLYSDNPDERYAAVMVLGNLGELAIPATPFLIGILGDQARGPSWSDSFGMPIMSPSIGEAAAGALVQIKDTNSVIPLMQMLRNKDEHIQWNAIFALTNFDKNVLFGHFQYMIAALEDNNFLIRGIAAKALGRIQNPNAVTALEKAITKEKEHWEVTRASIESLGQIGDLRAIAVLINLLKNKDLEYDAKKTLSAVGKPAVVPLIALMDSKDGALSQMAKEILIWIGQPAADELISSLQSNSNEIIRANSALVLGHISSPAVIGAVKALISALHDDRFKDVRANAALALGAIINDSVQNKDLDPLRYPQSRVYTEIIKDPVLYKALVDALGDPEWEVKRNVSRALKELDPYCIEAITTDFKDPEGEVNAEILQKMVSQKDPKIIMPLIEAVTDSPSISGRIYAAKALGEIKDERSIEPLIKCLRNKEENEEVLINAAISLGQIKNERSIEALISCLKDNAVNFYVRREAARILGQINEPRVIESLISVISNMEIQNILKNLTGQDFGRDQVKWQLWWEENLNKTSQHNVEMDKFSLEDLLAVILKDKNRDVRLQAIKKIADIKDPAVIDALSSLLKDEDLYVKMAAIRGLGRIMAEVQNEDPDIRKAAIRMDMGKVKKPEVIEPLIALLKDENPMIRIVTAQSLAPMIIEAGSNDEGVSSALLVTVRDSSPEVQMAVIEAIGGIKHIDAVKFLFRVMRIKKFEFRSEVINIIGKRKDRQTVDLMTAILKDKYADDRSRLRAVDILKLMQDSETIESLILAMNDDQNEYVRGSAVEALAGIKDPRTVELVINACKKRDDVYLRICALRALSQIEDSRRIDILINSLQDDDSNVKRHAILAMGEIKDTRFVDPLCAMLKDKNQSFGLRSDCARILGKIEDIRAVESLIMALKDEEQAVRSEAATALCQIKDYRATEALIGLLNDSSDIRRSYFARALTEITGQNFGPDQVKWQEWWEEGLNKISEQNAVIDQLSFGDLLAALKDKNRDIRLKVIKKIAGIKEPGKIDALVESLQDEDVYCRMAAIKGLGGIIAEVQSEDPDIKEAAIRMGMGKIKDPNVIKALVTLLNDANSAIRGITSQSLAPLITDRGVFLALLITILYSSADEQMAVIEPVGKIKNDQAKEFLSYAQYIKNEDQFELAKIMLRQKDRQMVDLIAEALTKNVNEKTRIWAARILKEIKDPSTIESLISAMGDQNEQVRGIAVEALAGIKNSRAVELVLDACNKRKLQDKYLRICALRALPQIEDPRRIDILIAALNDKATGVLINTCLAMGEIKDPRFIEPLLAKFEGQSESVGIALAKITGQNFGQDKEKWQQWWGQSKEQLIKGSIPKQKPDTAQNTSINGDIFSGWKSIFSNIGNAFEQIKPYKIFTKPYYNKEIYGTPWGNLKRKIPSKLLIKKETGYFKLQCRKDKSLEVQEYFKKSGCEIYGIHGNGWLLIFSSMPKSVLKTIPDIAFVDIYQPADKFVNFDINELCNNITKDCQERILVSVFKNIEDVSGKIVAMGGKIIRESSPKYLFIYILKSKLIDISLIPDVMQITSYPESKRY